MIENQLNEQEEIVTLKMLRDEVICFILNLFERRNKRAEACSAGRG